MKDINKGLASFKSAIDYLIEKSWSWNVDDSTISLKDLYGMLADAAGVDIQGYLDDLSIEDITTMINVDLGEMLFPFSIVINEPDKPELGLTNYHVDLGKMIEYIRVIRSIFGASKEAEVPKALNNLYIYMEACLNINEVDEEGFKKIAKGFALFANIAYPGMFWPGDYIPALATALDQYLGSLTDSGVWDDDKINAVCKNKSIPFTVSRSGKTWKVDATTVHREIRMPFRSPREMTLETKLNEYFEMGWMDWNHYVDFSREFYTLYTNAYSEHIPTLDMESINKKMASKGFPFMLIEDDAANHVGSPIHAHLGPYHRLVRKEN